MNPKTTTWLVVTALGLFAFIYVYERFLASAKPSDTVAGPLLPQLKASAVTGLQVRHGKEFVHLERAGGAWRLRRPLVYPAQPAVVDGLLQALGRLARLAPVAATATPEFGFDEPQADIIVQQDAHHTEIQLGSRTALGDQVYLRVVGEPGIYVVEGGLLERIPRTANGWRDPTLLRLDGLAFDRVEVRAGARGFALQRDGSNSPWRLAKPMTARADAGKVELFLRKMRSCQVGQFVSDDPQTDLDRFGLQSPELELAFGQGTNDLLLVQFGKSPTNDAGLVYARHSGHTNIVLITREIVEALRVPVNDWRDRHLLTFSPDVVDLIEVRGEENFTVQRLSNTVWRMVEPQPFVMDPFLTLEWFARLNSLEVTVEKDVVTDLDLATYGLAKPTRQFVLKTTATVPGFGPTNRLFVQLDFGTNPADNIFAHRSDENSVYSVKREDYLLLPSASWQLRDRRIWNFPATHVQSVTLRRNDLSRQLVRNAAREWTLAAGASATLDSRAIETALEHLGQLSAEVWVAHGEQHRARFGFADNDLKLVLEVRNTDKTDTFTVEFGGRSPFGHPYAAVLIEGQTWILEFPGELYREIQRYLAAPPENRAGGPELNGAGLDLAAGGD